MPGKAQSFDLAIVRHDESGVTFSMDAGRTSDGNPHPVGVKICGLHLGLDKVEVGTIYKLTLEEVSGPKAEKLTADGSGRRMAPRPIPPPTAMPATMAPEAAPLVATADETVAKE